MRGECQICKIKVVDDIDVSNTLYEYSKARILEQFFYNEKLENAGTFGCAHRSMRDIQWIFTMPGGYQITFTYIGLEVFTIEMIQPKSHNTGELFKNEVQKKMLNLQVFMNQLTQEIKTQMVKLSQYISDQDSKLIEQYNAFADSCTKDQKKEQKFCDMILLKQILSCIDSMLIGAGSE